MIGAISHRKTKEKCVITGGIVILKLVLMGLFSSDYQDTMFCPFVNVFLSGLNPYEYYYENDLMSSFPYPPLMLLIESIGGILLKIMPIRSIFLQNMIFKIPLLIFDFICFYAVRKLGIRYKYAAVFYFYSPVMLYGTFMHGQLDIIPTSLLVAAIYYLTNWGKKNNLLVFSIMLGLAVSTKFHIIAAVPILFMYVATKKGALKAVCCMTGAIAVAGAFVIPFWGSGLWNTVFLNKEQLALMTVFIEYSTTRILIPVIVLLMIYFRAYELNYFNKELLISMLGLLFSVFLICISPMPAWYTWIVPFIAIYFGYVTVYKYKIMLVYTCFNCAYLLYFVLFHNTGNADILFLGESLQRLKIPNLELKYIMFTVMVSFLSMVIYNIFKFGIASNGLYRRRNIPFTIGIAGDSGSGKSRMIEKIERLFGTGRDILFIEGDGDHKWERGNENWSRYTALDPKANYLYRQANDIHALRLGNHVQRVDYDHNAGVFTKEQRIRPQKYIVLCGLHSLYLPQLRRELDLKIYLDTEEELRRYWKIERDSRERGYEIEDIITAIDKRIPDAEKYIYPQKQYADLVISYFDDTLTNCRDMNHQVILGVKLSVTINIDLESVINIFHEYDIFPQHTLSQDLAYQEIVFNGRELEKNVDFGKIAEKTIPQYEDLFTYHPKWGCDVEGIIQLFLLIIISKKMRGGNT